MNLNILIKYLSEIEYNIIFPGDVYTYPIINFKFPNFENNLAKFNIQKLIINWANSERKSTINVKENNFPESYQIHFDNFVKTIEGEIDRAKFENKTTKIANFIKLSEIEKAKIIIELQESIEKIQFDLYKLNKIY